MIARPPEEPPRCAGRLWLVCNCNLWRLSGVAWLVNGNGSSISNNNNLHEHAGAGGLHVVQARDHGEIRTRFETLILKFKS